MMLIVYTVFVFFFFFKQKTAYEMRISDWSSDVCSSDLRCVEAAAAYQRFDPAHFLAVVVLHFQYVLPAFRETDRAFECRRELGVALLERRQQEIGRASCRERVCQ